MNLYIGTGYRPGGEENDKRRYPRGTPQEGKYYVDTKKTQNQLGDDVHIEGLVRHISGSDAHYGFASGRFKVIAVLPEVTI